MSATGPSWQIIPANKWNSHGNWGDTLKSELKSLSTGITTMRIKTTQGASMYFAEKPPLFCISFHERGEQWEPLNTFVGYEYCWDSTDGRRLDELNIRGPFSEQILLQILEMFERLGNPLHDRWDAVIILE